MGLRGWRFPSYAEALLLLYGKHGEDKARYFAVLAYDLHRAA